MNILTDFQICISVPSINFQIIQKIDYMAFKKTLELKWNLKLYTMASCLIGDFYLVEIEKIGIFSFGCPSIVLRFPRYYELDFYASKNISLKETQLNGLCSFVRRIFDSLK